jgi:hypothetical protein
MSFLIVCAIFISMLIFRTNHFCTNVMTDCTAVGCKIRFSSLGSICGYVHTHVEVVVAYVDMYTHVNVVVHFFLHQNEFVFGSWSKMSMCILE